MSSDKLRGAIGRAVDYVWEGLKSPVFGAFAGAFLLMIYAVSVVYSGEGWLHAPLELFVALGALGIGLYRMLPRTVEVPDSAS